MAISPTRFIKRWAERIPKSKSQGIPLRTRGIYALLRSRADRFDVVYIGMAATGGIRSRLRDHNNNQTKLWSHFSVFEVWDNISREEVAELEGLFREIYSNDGQANRFNKQRKCKRLRLVQEDDFQKWKEKEAKS